MSNKTERTAKSGASKGLPAIAVAVIVLAVLLIPCCLAAASHTIYPRTSVAGISVGGLDCDEASALLREQLPGAYETQTLPITVDRSAAAGEGEDNSAAYELSLRDLHITADADAAAQAAYDAGRSGNFFTEGVAYAKSVLFGRSIAPELTIDRAAAEEAIAAIAAQADVPTTECSYRLDGDTLYVTKPKSGYVLDRQALLQSVNDAVAQYQLSGISCALTEKDAASVTMADIYSEVHTEPANAYYDRKTGAVADGTAGVDFDADAAQTQMDAAAPGETVAVQVTRTEPSITKEQMSALLFRDKLGTCSTSVSGTANRKHNVGLAAKSCNGVVLNPGEVFSYNETLGQRTAANGYLQAGAYVNGKTVSEYGGGICQVSSTLYLAVLRSNLEIVSRTNHMFYPGYIPYGMDATVSWGGPDFKFRNNTDYPIRLSVAYSGGQAVCTIYGTNVSGTSVKMEYDILSTTNYETVEKEDASLAPGTTRQEQNGYTGYKVATYRCVYDSSGKLISRKLETNSTYKSRNRILLVGPAKATAPAESTQPGTTTPPATPAAPTTPEENTGAAEDGSAAQSET